MLEEIKLTFKAKKGLSFDELDLYVGIVVHKNKKNRFYEIELSGKDLISNKQKNTFITNQQHNNDYYGLHSIKYIDHIEVGDILLLKRNNIRSLFRINSPNNSIFATIRCNSNCLMCSQPPLDYDDIQDNIRIWIHAIKLMPDNLSFIGVTGGEPTLLGDGLVKIINALLIKYPNIVIDILSNGRLQAKQENIDILSKIIDPHRVIFAIPLYSDIYKEHDYIVQAKDAFHQTCLGIHNLTSIGFFIEIRIVLHKLSIKRLYELSKFIHSNFPFTHHVTFMGLEMVGYTKANKDILLIENQKNYIDKLSESLRFLDRWNYTVSIYNTPFCQLPEHLWRYAKQSISDWKNSYHKECERCILKKDCAGFFSWNIPHTEAYPIEEHYETNIN